MRSVQRSVELRRLGNQLPVLGNANSLWKIVKLCVFCLFVTLRLSPGQIMGRDKDIPGYRSSGKIRVASRRCTSCAPGGEKNYWLPLFTLFRPLCPAFSFADVDTWVIFSTWQQLRKKLPLKKSREGQICQLSWPCVDVLTCNTSNRFNFRHFFAKIQEFQNGAVTVSKTCVSICVT